MLWRVHSAMALEIGDKAVTHTNGHGAEAKSNGNGRAASRANGASVAATGGAMTSRQSALSAISNLRVGATQDYLEHAGEEIYGQYVFNESVQRKYLAKPIFEKLRKTIDGNEPF